MRLVKRVRAVGWVAWLFLALALSIWTACSTPGEQQAVTIVQDRQLASSRRLAAMDVLGPIEAWPDPAAARALLGDIVWSDNQPDALRIMAVDRLVAHDERGFRIALDRRVADINRWPVLLHIFEIARQRQWVDFTATAVRSYARPSTQFDDLQRPERALIEDLHPGRTVEDVVLEQFIGMTHGEAERSGAVVAVAAWTVLNRLASPSAVEAMLMSAPPVTALVRDLQAAAAVVDVLPGDLEAVRWLMAVRARDQGRWWQRAAAAAAELTPAQRRGLALRHLPALLAMPSPQRTASREALTQLIADRLHGAVHAVRTEYGAVPGAVSEAFADHAPVLAWGDLATILTLLDAMTDRRVVKQWFVQADADLMDTRTEFGGVLAVDDYGAVTAKLFPPILAVHDRKFYSSDALIQAMYTGLAHYHFHAQRHDNAAFAGPGGGDLQFADRLGANALVLSFIDRETLNVDYYQPGRVVIDLGMIRR